MATLEQEFNKAVERFQSGQLKSAEKILLRLNKRQGGIADVLHMLAFIAMETDRPQQAVAHLTGALKSVPGNPALLNLLGVAHHKSGDAEQAIEILRKALQIDPGLPGARYNLANALQDAGKYEDAGRAYHEHLKHAPKDVGALHGLGQVMWALGDHAGACASYRSALEIDPGDDEIHFALGSALAHQGQLEAGLKHARQARELDPENHQAVLLHADILCRMNRPEDALDELAPIMSKASGMAGLHRVHATACELAGNQVAALASLEKAAQLSADDPDIMAARVNLLEKTGELDEAVRLVDAGLELHPDHYALRLLKARLSYRAGEYDGALGLLDGLDGEAPMVELERDRSYELGRVHDRLGNTGEAFESFVKANTIAGEIWQDESSRKEALLGYIDRHLEIITKDWVSTWPSSGEASSGDQAPVFMVGFPRSGTTLVDQILDAHPGIQVLEEKPMLQRVRAALLEMDGSYPELLPTLRDDECDELRKCYFAEADRQIERDTSCLLVDKMPLNLVDAALVHRLFPDARFIFSLRHPCDACLSCFMQHFEMNAGMSNFLTLEDTSNLYAKAMTLWQSYRELLPLKVHTLRYEDLLDDLEGSARALASFLDLQWSEDMLEFDRHAAERNILTPSYAQVTQGLYTHARYRWTRYEDQLAPVLPTLQPFIDAFGYGDA